METLQTHLKNVHLPEKIETRARQPKQNPDVHKNVFLLFLLHHLHCTTTHKGYAKTQLIDMAGPSDIVCYPKSWGYLFIAIC